MMKFKLLLIFAMFMLLISFVSATVTEFCYQETANDSSVVASNPAIQEGTCGIYNGSYHADSQTTNKNLNWDGDWTSADGTALGDSIFVNYTKPLGVLLTNTRWQVSGATIFPARNLSINSSCWDQSPLQLRINRTGGSALTFLCYTGSTWAEMNFSSGGSIFWEESMWWEESVGIDSCSTNNITVLRINGKDEETDIDVNLTLNIFIEPISPDGENISIGLSGQTNYSFCANRNMTINSIMEYGGGSIYTARKYYLNNLSLSLNDIANVTLYHLNNSKASEITFTVFDTVSGDKVEGAFIEILRYYPEDNIFRVVEIAKTDEVGQSLGKMVLADVFYKFIIEFPAGVTRLDTGILRVLSLTRSFGISFGRDFLDTWTRINNVDTLVSCTKATKTCRIVWNDANNIVQDVTLEVWRMTGLADKMLFSKTTAAASGTISYTVVEDVESNRYVAKGFVESNTGRTTYPTGWASFFYSDNPFFTDPAHRIASLFPLLLLVIVIVFALVDFGVVGVTIGALLGLITGSIVEILPLSPFYLISFILIGIILIYKLSK